MTIELVSFVSSEVGMTQQQRDIKRKLAVLEYAGQTGNVAKTCRHFAISQQSHYD